MKLFTKIIARSIVILSLPAVFFIPAMSWADAIDELKSEIGTIQERIRDIDRSVAGTDDELSGKLKKIADLKERQETGYNIFREFELENLLKNARDLTNLVSSLVSKKSELENTLNEKRRTLLSTLDARLQELFKGIKHQTVDRTMALSELKRFLLERSTLIASLPPYFKRGKDYFSVENGDSAEEILDKAQILKDYLSRLQREMAGVNERLAFLKKQSSALSEVARLLDEENFFGETGFVIASKKKDDILATAKEGLSPVKTEQTGTATLPPSQDQADGSSDAAITPPSTLQTQQAEDSKAIPLSNPPEGPGRQAALDSTKKNLQDRIARNGDINDEIAALEKESSELKNLITEVEDKYGLMKKEAGRLQIPKTQ